MALEFFKYHGTGNDFIVMDDRHEQFECQNQSLIQDLCDRHFGVGADGLILIQNQAGVHFKMRYFNADGLPGSMCGNGGRCAVHLAKELGIIGQEGEFEAPDGRHHARMINGKISISINEVSEIKPMEMGLFVDTGSPHVICFYEDIADLDVDEIGRKMRQEFSEQGANINFVMQNHDGFKMRTYERGVEAETLSCGTGATAAAVAILETGRSQDSSIELNTRGGRLEVGLQKQGSTYKNVWLTGPVVQVYRGFIG